MNKYSFFVVIPLAVVLVALFSFADFVSADNVTVSAMVTASVTCSAATTTSAFGTLTVGSISTSVPNVTSTMSCNYGAGCTLSVNDAGNSTNPGLWSSTASRLIQSGTATLVAGTEGYGIQATTTAAGGGGTLSLSATYNKTGTNVGGLLLSSAVLASSSAPISSREVVVTHKAAIDGLTAAGNYTDTITYSCTGN